MTSSSSSSSSSSTAQQQQYDGERRSNGSNISREEEFEGLSPSTEVSRRDGFFRHFSVGNLGSTSTTTATASETDPEGRVHIRTSSNTSLDMAMFQESWSNTESGIFLGGVASLQQSLTKQRPPRSSSFGGFGAPLSPMGQHPWCSRSVSITCPGGTGDPNIDMYGVSSVIHDAARITDWDKVLELCKTHSEAASYSGRDGWTALHHACNRRCPRPDVVEALIRAYPEALLQEEEKSWLPLHYACRFKAPKEVVRLLLYMYPVSGRLAVETRDRQGRRPLYYAVRYDAPEGVAGLLIAVDPSAVLEEDQNDESPLALIWDSWAEKLEGKRIVHSFLPGGFPEPEETPMEERASLLRGRLQKERKLNKRWEQVNMLLKAAFGFPFEDRDIKNEALNASRKWRIVHATAAVKCHLSLFLLACALYPEQAQELDESDLRRPDAKGIIRLNSPSSHQTALHLAASSNAGGEPGKTVVISLLSLYREAAHAADGIDGSLPLHLMVENPKKQDWPTHAAILYHFYPRAVQIPDLNGKLPLHRATAAITHEDHEGDQERSVIIQLVRSFPQAASHVDATGCVPFHYLAMNAKIWDEEADSVLNAHRGVLQMRAGPTWNGRQPIHMAAANPRARESLILRLVQLHPRGASIEDRSGQLPLHLACECGKEWNHGTRCIYEAFPNALRQPENRSRGWLPLHMAAASVNASAALIAQLVKLYPEAADIPDNQGRFPLHLACSSGKRWFGGLKALFEASPVAIATCDRKGLLPLHICSLSYCKKKDVHKAMTRAVPKLQEEKESALNKKEAAQIDIIFNLLRAYPSTILPQESQCTDRTNKI